jgi:hypothetical protein
VTTRIPFLTLLLVAGLAGCATPPPGQAAAPETSIRLSATLISATDITLEWQNGEPDAAGHIVEFATEPHGRYTILQFLPPHQTTFTHPDLMPETSFHYRVRPFYGPASRPIEITLPEGPMGSAKKDDHAWAAPRSIPGGPIAEHAIRMASADAAPTGLKAAVMHANGVRFRWTDRAVDEEGYLLEGRPEGSADFGVITVLDPNVNSYGLITLPNEKKSSFRVRAFYYGKPSNLAGRTTGTTPPGG